MCADMSARPLKPGMHKNMTSPMTRQPLRKALTPNSILLRQIRAWEQAQDDYDIEAAKFESAVMVVPIFAKIARDCFAPVM